jgi:putative component of membrane protein insertase Oxa1/YidC/SpoIIIJ protein YidD
VVREVLHLYPLLALATLPLVGVWEAAGLPAHLPAAFPIHFYQRVVGPVDGRSCPAAPVCSGYAREAIAAHGLWLGAWLSLDRLIHEHDDLADGPWARVEGRRRLEDPLHRNDAWLRR